MAVDFQWMAGFECSAFPQVGRDELAETEHYRWWASDLVRLHKIGVKMIRYGIPWPRVNPRPHEYDWEWVDQAIDLMETLGITPIIDLFHYGTPLWIEGGFMHPIFGQIQSWYAKAFAQRYPQITYYTPTNEPYVCAFMGAEIGIWYPFLQGPPNFCRAVKNLSEGICRSMAEILQINPHARMISSEPGFYYHALDDMYAERADFYFSRSILPHDLYQGLVDDRHPMRKYMLEHGVRQEELDWFLKNRATLDIHGLGYYDNTERQFRLDAKGFADEIAEKPLGWAKIADLYSKRYDGIPIVVAETSSVGSPEERARWIDMIVEQTREARTAGTPVAGITYYGALDHIDWDSVLRVRNLNIVPCGLWNLERTGDRMKRTSNMLVDRYHQLATMPTAESVGELTSIKAQARIHTVLAGTQPNS